MYTWGLGYKHKVLLKDNDSDKDKAVSTQKNTSIKLYKHKVKFNSL